MKTSSITTVAACLLAASCASHEISGGEYDEIAQIVGASVATPDGGGLLGGAADSAMLALGELPRGFTGDPGGMSTGEHFGVSCTYMVFCTDAAGARLDRCSPAADRATVIGAWDGTLAMSGFGGTVERHGTWTLANMTSGTATLSGASGLAYHATFSASGAHYQLASTETVDLRLDMASHAIAGGSMTAHLAADRTMDGGHGMQGWSYELDAEVTFTPDAAKLVLDGAYAYRVDLATGAVMPWLVR